MIILPILTWFMSNCTYALVVFLLVWVFALLFTLIKR